jgi:DNA-binding transcriptional LysR family regulator
MRQHPGITLDIAAGHLVRVLEEWSEPIPGFYLHCPSRRQMPPALRAVIEFFRHKG